MNWQSFGSGEKQNPRYSQRAIQLLLEVLEDRQVPALLLDAGSQALADDPTLLKFPGMKTPFSADKMIVTVDGQNGFDYFKTFIQNQGNRDLNNAIDFSKSSLFWETPNSSMLKIALNKDVDPVGVWKEVQLLPKVEYASLNFVYRPQEGYGKADYIPNDPFAGPSLSQQYHHGIIEDYKAWESVRGTSSVFTGPGGAVRGPIIAVTDNGFDITHNDLKNAMWVNTKETPGNGIDDDNNGYVDDVNGVNISVARPGMVQEASGFIQPSNAFDDHGTHVAGIIGAQMDNNLLVSGVAGGGAILPDGSTAPTAGARIMGIKNNYTQVTNGVLTNISYYDSFIVVEGLKYALKMGADIVSTSEVIISGQAPLQFPTLSDDQSVFDAYKILHDAGKICLVAAANDDLDNTNALEKLPYVIWVASTDDTDQKSSFSNYGKTIDVSAPGSNILSLAPGNFFQFLSGTSMATPVAAGVVALIKAAHPDWTRDQIVSQLYATANNIDKLNPQYAGDLGHGRVNSFGAVTSSSGFVAVSNGQNIIAGADLDGSVKIWDRSGRLQQNIPVTPGRALTSIALDGDLQMVVGSSDGSIYSFSRLNSQSSTWFRPSGKLDTGSPVVSIQLGSQNLAGVAFAVNAKGEAYKYDFNSKISTKISVGSPVTLSRLNSNQSYLALALKNGGFSVFNPATLALVTSVAGTVPITALDFTRGPATNLVTGLQDGSVLAWDLTGQPPTSKLISTDSNTAILSLSVGQGNSVSYGFADGRVYVRNLSNGSFINQVSLPREPVLDGSGKPVNDDQGNPLTETVSSILILPGGTEFAVATKSREIFRFSLAKASSQNFGAGVVKAVAISNQGGTFSRAIGLADGSVSFLSNSAVIGSIAVSSNPIVKLQWNPTGSILGAIDSTGKGYLVYFPGTASSYVITLVDSLVSSVTQMAFSQDGLSLATATAEGSIYEWDLTAAVKTPKFTFTVPSTATYPVASPGLIMGLAYTPDGKYLATADQAGFSRLWNRDPLDTKNRDSKGNFVPTYVGTLGNLGDTIVPLTSIAASPNSGFIALGNQLGQAVIFDLSNLKLIARSQGASGPVVSLAFTSGSQSIILGTSDGLVRLVQTTSGSQLSAITKSDSPLVGLSLDSTGAVNGILDFLVAFQNGEVQHFFTRATDKSSSFLGQGNVPTIGGISGLPGNGQSTNVIPTDIQITFSGLFDLAKFQSQNAVRLVGRGPDGIFNTSDDTLVSMAPAESLAIGTNSANYRILGVLPPDVYQVRVNAGAAVSPFGEKLDGNGDGVPGDDYIGPVFEYLGASGTIYGRVTAGLKQFTKDQTGIGDRRVYVDLNNNGLFDAIYSPGGEGPTKTANATQVPKAIDNSAPTTAFLNVNSTTGRAGAITSINPKMTIKHTWVGDLTGYLEAPDGTRIELFANLPGAAGRRITGLKDIEFRNDPTLPTLSRFISNNLFSGKQILTGAVRPTGDLGAFNGLSTYGQWKLIIIDDTVADNGYLQSWSLKFQTSEPTSVQNIINSNTGNVDYVTTTDVNGYYAIPNMGAGLAPFTSAQFNVLLDNNSADQLKFADFVDVFPVNGTRQVTVDTRSSALKNDYQELLARPASTLSYGLKAITPDSVIDVNNLANFTLDLTPQVFAVNGVNGGSFARGPSLGTVSDRIQVFADANNDGILTPNELVKTVDFSNGKTTTTVSNPLANPTNPLKDGTYTIYAAQVALDRYTSPAVKLGQVNLKSTPPGAPVISSVSPVLNTIIPTKTPTFVGTSEPSLTIQLFLSGTNTMLGTVASDATGQWSIPVTTALAEGKNTVEAFALDFLGNKSVVSAPFSLTVDSVGPAAPVITNIVGASPNAKIPTAIGVYFSQTTPSQLVVNFAEKAIARVFLNGVEILKTAQPVGPGQTSLDLPSIAENAFSSPHILTVTQTNGFGIEGKPSDPVKLVINKDAPVAPNLTSIISDSGRSASDLITNVNTLLLGGNAVAWSLVSVKVDGILVNTIAADASGKWQLDYTKVALGEGLHSVVLQAQSATGVNGPVSSAFGFTIDKTAPGNPAQVGVQAPFGAIPGFTNNPTPTILGMGEVNAIVNITDGTTGAPLGTGLVGPDGKFAVPLTQALGMGSKSVKITLTDVAGNTSSPFTYAFVIQPGSPSGPVAIGKISQDTGFSDSDGITRGLIGTVTGTAPLLTRIRIVADAGTPNEINLSPTDGDLVIVDGSGQWTYINPKGIPLIEGRHSLTAIAIDQAGNVLQSAPFRVIVDFTAPRDTVISSVSSSTGNNELGFTDQYDFTVGGRAEAFARVTLSLGSVQLTNLISVSQTGTWSFKIPAGQITGNGLYQLKVDTLDAAGNQSRTPAVLNVQVEKGNPSAPQIDGLKGLDGNFGTITNLSRMVISGRAPVGAKVQVSLTPQGGSEQDLGLAIADQNGIWTLDNSQILRASGDYTVRARVVGRTGAISSAAELVVRIDTVAPNAPAITGFGPGVPVFGQNLVGSSSPVILGTAEPRARVEIEALSENGLMVRGTGITDDNGKWSVSLSGLENAAIQLTSKVRDAAGNLSQASTSLNFKVDTTGPIALVQSPTNGGVFNPQSWLGEFSGTSADTVAGTREVGLAIKGPNGLYFDGAKFGSAAKVFVTAQGTNAWKLPFPVTALRNGTTSFTVRATDYLGNVSESTEQSFNFGSDLSKVTTFKLVPGTGAGVFQGTLVFSTPVTGLTISGFITSNAVISGLSGSGSNYTFTATAQKPGRFTVSVAAGAAQDQFGTGNQASETLARGYAPGSSFKLAPGQGTTTPFVRVIGANGIGRDYQVFDSSFHGGVRAALTDFNNDGIADIFAVPGIGGGPVFKVINGATGATVQSTMAFSANYTGGLFVASGDVNGDGFIDAILSTGGGGTGQVKVFSGKDFKTVLSNFIPYNGYAGAVTVAAGDTNGDGAAEIITGTGSGVRADVRIWTGLGKFVQSVTSPTGAGTAGVFVAAADLNRDGFAEVIIGTGLGVSSEVRVNYLNAGPGKLPPAPQTIRPFDNSFKGGARVGVADVDGDGFLDLVIGSGNGGAVAKRYEGLSLKLIDQMFLEGNISGGVFV